MTDLHHIDPEDLMLHAMHLLSPDEAAAVQAHLEQCSECWQEFMAAQSDLLTVALSVDPQTPSSQARERFLRQVSREKRIVPIDAPVRTRQDAATDTTPSGIPMAKTPHQQGKAGALLPWIGWAVAAGVTFSAVSLYHERGQLQTTVADQSAQLRSQTAQMASMSADASRARDIMDALTDSSAMRVTLNTTPSAKALPQGRAAYVADKGTLIFIADNLNPLPLSKVYELWLIPSDGTHPLPAGTFHPDARGNATVILPELPKSVEAKAFGVTVEAEGGATSPTLPIILVGA